MTALVNLDEYFARVGYRGPTHPTTTLLHALTAAHAQSIPFENLDVLLGKTISLEIGAVFQKLVRDRRGGYCFEQNGLFLHVLEMLKAAQTSALGARTTAHSGQSFVTG